MNRFLKTTVTSGVAALAVVATVGAVPALAHSHSSESHNAKSELEHMHDNDPGPSGASDPLVATGTPAAGSTSYYAWPIASTPSDAASIDQQIRRLPAGRFNVVHLDLTGSNRNAGVISDRVTEPHYLADLHRSIDANRPLLARLEAKNVEIRNVIGAEPGGDGSMTFDVQ
jgi:hypothetical protein